MIGFHVTAKENMKSIKENGLMGSEWTDNFETSFSDPFNLVSDGAVFCFPTLEDAELNKWDWDNGRGVVILKVSGNGEQFTHYAEGEQIAIRANTATWELCE